jgi:hypothetical protein
MIESRRLRWVGHVARAKWRGTAYRALLGKSAVKRPLERNRLRWKVNVETSLKGIRMEWCNLHLSGSGGYFRTW